MADLVSDFDLEHGALSHLTSSVQLGFISGTLIFAFLTIADRFSPSRVFLISAVLGSLSNAGIILENNSFVSLLVLRFFTGFFLAGIYPVGMKIASDYYDKGLGKSLGFLVGALVAGAAFPHLLKNALSSFPWASVILTTSGLAFLGGLMIILWVPDGPQRQVSQSLDLTASFKVFRNPGFRSAAFGYFGHMWELYTFWAFVPVILRIHMMLHAYSMSISAWSFIIIGAGGLACVVAGYLSLKFGTKTIAFSALLLSGLCCLVSPLMFLVSSSTWFLVFLVFWGMVVVADSPLFSTLVAQKTSSETKGTALTIVNCIGFSITIVSIQLTGLMEGLIPPTYVYSFLAVGPLLGLVAIGTNDKHKEPRSAPDLSVSVHSTGQAAAKDA